MFLACLSHVSRMFLFDLRCFHCHAARCDVFKKTKTSPTLLHFSMELARQRAEMPMMKRFVHDAMGETVSIC